MTEPRRRAEDFDSRPETLEHIGVVRRLVFAVVADLIGRGEAHDASKLEEPEKSVFDKYTKKLRDTEYGSNEYEQFREMMGPGLAHHYEVNDHHPEHFPAGEEHETEAHDESEYFPGGEITVCRAWCNACDWTEKGDPDDTRNAAWSHEMKHHKPGGIHDMNLLQITEMLCDWIAAGRRHEGGGDIHKSIRQNAARFEYGDEIERMLHLSADAILAMEVA